MVRGHRSDPHLRSLTDTAPLQQRHYQRHKTAFLQSEVWSEATDQIHIAGPLQIQLFYSSDTTSGIRQPSCSQRWDGCLATGQLLISAGPLQGRYSSDARDSTAHLQFSSSSSALASLQFSSRLLKPRPICVRAHQPHWGLGQFVFVKVPILYRRCGTLCY